MTQIQRQDVPTGWVSPLEMSFLRYLPFLILFAFTGVKPSMAQEKDLRPPVWESVSLDSAEQGELYEGSIVRFATDPQGSGLRFEKVSGPAWLSLAPDGRFTGTAHRSDIGTATFVFRAFNGKGLSADTSASLTVKRSTRPPHWKEKRLTLADAVEDRAYEFDLASYVENADHPVFSKSSGPLWLTVSSKGKLGGTPSAKDQGNFEAEFEISEGEVHAALSARGRVMSKAHPPVFKQPALRLSVKEWKTLEQSLNDSDIVQDPNGDPLRFALTPSAPWINLSPVGKLVAKPTGQQVGENSFTIRVTNGTLDADGKLTIQVLPDPPAPKWKKEKFAFAAKAREPFTTELSSQVSDPDGLPLTFSKDRGPDWLKVTAAGNLSGIPTDSDVGADRFRITAVNEAQSADVEVDIEVAFKNHPPVVDDSRLKFGVKERETLERRLDHRPYVEEIDPQDKLTFQLDGQKPDWMGLSKDGLLRLAPGFKQIGDHTFSFHVSDGTDSVPGTIQVTVLRSPRPPIWKDHISPIKIRARHRFQEKLKDKVVDLDGLPLIFEKKSGPDWLKLEPDGSLSGLPDDNDIGESKLVMTASNDARSAETEIPVKVVFNRRPPFFLSTNSVLPEGKLGEHYEYSVSGLAIDPDPPHTLIFSKASGPSWARVTSDGVINGDPAAKDVGNHSLVVRTTNTEGQFAESTFDVKIGPKNSPPKLRRDRIDLPLIGAGELLLFDVTPFVFDPDGDPLKFKKLNGPEWISVSDTGQITGVPEAGDSPSYEVDIRVSDGRLNVNFTVKGKIKPSGKKAAH